MINGIINVYKEPGWTSSDVVVKLRHILAAAGWDTRGRWIPWQRCSAGVRGEATQLPTI